MDDCLLIVLSKPNFATSIVTNEIAQSYATSCYPETLTMEPTLMDGNSLLMLESHLSISGTRILARHYNKNESLIRTNAPLLNKILPYSTNHINKTRLTRGILKGLVCRIIRNTSDLGIPCSLGLLDSYVRELDILGYPKDQFLSIFRRTIFSIGLEHYRQQQWLSVLHAYALLSRN